MHGKELKKRDEEILQMRLNHEKELLHMKQSHRKNKKLEEISQMQIYQDKVLVESNKVCGIKQSR